MQIGDLEIRLFADIARLTRDMAGARRVVDNAANDMRRAADLVKNALGGIGAGLSLAAMVQQVVAAQREFDKLHSSLVTATGSVAGAGEAFGALQKFAASTPFSLQEVTEGFLKLRNLGLTPSEAALRSYGNTSAAMGKSLNQMIEAVADAATGEFERLKEFGINAKQQGDQVALTFQGTTTKIGNNAAEIEAYLKAIGDVNFAGGMERQAATLDGALSNLGDTWSQTLVAFSQSGFGDVVHGSILALTSSLSDLGAMFRAVTGAAEAEGKKVEEISPLHSALTTLFETIMVLGTNVSYVLTAIGRDIGAMAAQAVAAASFNFEAVRRIREMRVADAKREREEVDRKTAAILGAAAAAKAARDKEAAEEKKDTEDKLARYKIQGNAAKQAAEVDRAGKAQAAAAERARLTAMKEAAEFEKKYSAALSMTADILAARVRDAEAEAARNEELARTYGMSKLAIEQEELARLENQLAQRASLGLNETETASLEKLIAAKKRNAAAIGTMEEGDGAKKARDEWKRTAESIEQSLTDALMRGFESGKGFGQNLVDTIKNMFNTLVLRPIVSAVVNPVAGAITGALGFSGAANAATGGGGAGSAVSTLGMLGSLTSGVGLLGAGGLGLQAGFGALMSSGLAGISGAVSGGIAAIGAGTASSIAAGIGTIAGALGPIALGIGAAVALVKKFDDSGTAHTGGASSASSAGVSTLRAESLGFQHTKVSTEANAMTAQLASGIVGILDSTALAFGKTAGYTAATAFADDTSKDGAWGALVIQKMGQDIVDWSDTRTSRWAPKEFADGEQGQAEYLAALSSSVRSALNSIGLPEWARTMLNGIASDASLEDLAAVVEQINATQSALAAMRAQLVGFSSLSDSAVSALMAASGGIDKLFSNASAYYDAFYSEAEKNAAASQQIAKALASVNLQMPTSRDGFRELVEAQMRLGAQGAEAVSVLLGVAGAFAQVTPEAQAATADLTSYRTALTDAYNAEADALKATISRMGSFATSLRNLNASTLLGNLSPLSPSQKYAEAKSQYEAVLAAARAGDEGAQGRYQDAYTAFLEASRTVFASSAGYTRDFDYAQAGTAEAAKWAEQQVDVGQAQLSALNASVAGLIEVNKSVLSVREALAQYNAALNKNTSPLTAVAPPVNTPIPYSSYGTSNTEALVAEVKSLRAEVAGLRSDQRQQTGDLIRGGAAASRDSAETMGRITESAISSLNRFNDRVAPE